MIRRGGFALALLALAAASPVGAEVTEATDGGFTVSHVRTVAARPEVVWAVLVAPARWWSAAHSWSGDAAKLSLDPKVGGCFCERWAAGEAEHARVIHVAKDRLLRLAGALGPLQGEALTGTLTFQLTPEGAGTKLDVLYVVGGHARFALGDIAPAVDQVIGEQVTRLAALFPEGG